jgi:hypothetical protein
MYLGNRQHLFVVPEYPLEHETLPEPSTATLTVMEPAQLFRQRHESASVAVITLPFGEQVKMVWHETVRHKPKAGVLRSTSSLLQDGGNDVRIREERAPLVRARRDEQPMTTLVVKCRKMSGFSGAHGRMRARCLPERAGVRLTPHSITAG